ncbi:MAG: hypothetical protein DME22_25755 [Verrucomicrobia bacterium]|nr:MAG: hypothetical protein DME22_25755 [Verrucomicrobiota bacterium]
MSLKDLLRILLIGPVTISPSRPKNENGGDNAGKCGRFFVTFSAAKDRNPVSILPSHRRCPDLAVLRHRPQPGRHRHYEIR